MAPIMAVGWDELIMAPIMAAGWDELTMLRMDSEGWAGYSGGSTHARVRVRLGPWQHITRSNAELVQPMTRSNAELVYPVA